MIDHCHFEKNRIRCPVRIRTNEYQLDKDRYTRDGSVKKIIRLGNSESMTSLNQSMREIRNFDDKKISYLNSSMVGATTPLAIRNSKIDGELEWPKNNVNKNNYMYDSCIKTQKSERTSVVSKGELTRRSDFGDFNDLDRNTSFQYPKNHNSSFQQPSKIVSTSYSLLTSRNLDDLATENSFLEQTIEEKNRQISSLTSNINEERRILETKILDLEFQIMNQKLSYERNIDSLNFSIGNIEEICRNRQNEIDGLRRELWQTHEYRRAHQQEQQMIIRELAGQKEQLQRVNQDLANELHYFREQIQIFFKQNGFLKEVIFRIQQEKALIEQDLDTYKKKLDEMLTKMLEMELIPKHTILKHFTEDRQIQVDQLSFDQIQGSIAVESVLVQCFQDNPEQELVKDKQVYQQNQQRLGEQVIENNLEINQQQQLMKHLKSCEEELKQNKKHMADDSKYIRSLEERMRQFERNIEIMGLNVPLLQETNQEMMAVLLRNLNRKFQQQTTKEQSEVKTDQEMEFQ